jgi:hypothetical protein
MRHRRARVQRGGDSARVPLVSEPWPTLIPLIVASAVLPIQIGITLLLLRSGGGRAAALAWVAGMTVVRLAQGALFGLVLGGVTEVGDEAAAGLIEPVLLFLVALLLLVMAAKAILKQPDEDAPPPRWIALVESATAARAFLLGVALVGLSAKLWAFTLGAIGAISDAGVGQPAAGLLFLVFVLGAESVHLVAIAVAFLAPARSAVWLERVSGALERYNRVILISIGLGFGAWFMVQSLAGLGLR